MSSDEETNEEKECSSIQEVELYIKEHFKNKKIIIFVDPTLKVNILVGYHPIYEEVYLSIHPSVQGHFTIEASLNCCYNLAQILSASFTAKHCQLEMVFTQNDRTNHIVSMIHGPKFMQQRRYNRYYEYLNVFLASNSNFRNMKIEPNCREAIALTEHLLFMKIVAGLLIQNEHPSFLQPELLKCIQSFLMLPPIGKIPKPSPLWPEFLLNPTFAY